MLRFLLPAVVLIAACSDTTHDRAAAPARESLTGQAAYDKVCSDCHDEGKGGAPAVGDEEAWAERSSLWTAVLEEHAKDGYLDMPAKGGESGMTDEEVSAAAAYMMSLTHPDQPPE